MSAKDTIEELCKRFELNEDIKERSFDRFKAISSDNSFSFTTKQTKNILSAVCLYLTLNEEHKPITITQICNTIGFNINDFGKVYNQVIKSFPHLKNESVSIEQLVGVTLKGAKIEDTERQQLITRVIELIRIVRECWLIEGRSPVHIIFGTAFLAWKSLNPSVRSKVKLTEFCNIVGIDYKHTTSERVNEIFNALKRLGQKIPGKEKFKFTKQNISIYINDILKYCNSLLFDLNNQFKSNNNSKDDNSSLKWINTFKRKSYYENKQKELEKQTIGSKETEEEISDSEIDCYIRTPKEVKQIKKLKKFVENEEEIEKEKEFHVNQLEKYLKIDGFF